MLSRLHLAVAGLAVRNLGVALRLWLLSLSLRRSGGGGGSRFRSGGGGHGLRRSALLQHLLVTSLRGLDENRNVNSNWNSISSIGFKTNQTLKLKLKNVLLEPVEWPSSGQAWAERACRPSAGRPSGCGVRFALLQRCQSMLKLFSRLVLDN